MDQYLHWEQLKFAQNRSKSLDAGIQSLNTATLRFNTQYMSIFALVRQYIQDLPESIFNICQHLQVFEPSQHVNILSTFARNAVNIQHQYLLQNRQSFCRGLAMLPLQCLTSGALNAWHCCRLGADLRVQCRAALLENRGPVHSSHTRECTGCNSLELLARHCRSKSARNFKKQGC